MKACYIGWTVAGLLLAGCMTARNPAPVSDRTQQPPAPSPVKSAPVAAKTAPATIARESDPRPEYYVVKKGDTLFTIALDHGLDHKELAEWNGIDNPNMIRADQQLRLRAPAATAVTAPLKSAPRVEGKPVGSAPAVITNEALKTQPKGVKVPYSDQALAQLSGQAQAKPVVPPAAKVDARAEDKPAASEEDDEKIDWGWPSGGKVLSTFNESTNLKGVGIAGKLGQAVIASAPGKVLYSGDGIRGYGKLVIIKHNKVYLSVYAHNSQLLVKEGQAVLKGQKIADMGASDSDQVKLHFEIRRFGKPIDPLKLLPAVPAT